MMILSTKKVAALSAVAMAGVLLLAGCSSTASPSGTNSNINIAGVVANTSDPFWQTVVCGAQAEAKSLGVTYKSFNTTSTDTNTIASNFQSASLTSPSGMIVQ